MNTIFESAVYENRRTVLKQKMQSGIALFLGNTEAPMNYSSNTYKYRQDSTFLYFFGLAVPDLAAVIDFDENREIIFGNDFDIDDIIWMGNQPSVQSLAEQAGVRETMPMAKLADYLAGAKGRKIHFIPPYRAETKITLSEFTGLKIGELKANASVELIKHIVTMRSVKETCEIEEMELACTIGVLMHRSVMKACKPEVAELELAGLVEGLALAKGNGVSFPVILSQHGETLHNHNHNLILKANNLLLTDAGAEGLTNYCSDYTRTIPVSGKFSQKQREIYELVLKANIEGIDKMRPGLYFKEVHRHAAEVIAAGLKELGLMKGDVKEAVELGAHALFFPHGLGHQLGLDVHDMENYGEDYVGYDDTVSRSNLFGWGALRMARELKSGFVITVEPGIYFIPQLIDIWKSEKRFENFINYDKVEAYRDFGGIRIEDDVLVTETSHKVLGPHLEKGVAELEEIMKK
jgi:Xaa-Pro aminopeptidase